MSEKGGSVTALKKPEIEKEQDSGIGFVPAKVSVTAIN
jgi:hypothetical protein